MEKIAIIGGGPSALFMLKNLLESGLRNIDITIFEKRHRLGAGMPYSADGANREHITNVSANEIPDIVVPIGTWLKSIPEDELLKYGIQHGHFNEYRVLPRLLFGDYLESQFDLLLASAGQCGVSVHVRLESPVVDLKENEAEGIVIITVNTGEEINFGRAIICSGHSWPKTHEESTPGYFDSPYPPSKLEFSCNHEVAVRGASLTAIDAIRTLARHNGTFTTTADGSLSYTTKNGSENFKIAMHSRSGLLPAVRFHLKDSHLSNEKVLSNKEIQDHIVSNGGFLSLDFLFENDFKRILAAHDPELYGRILDMSLEDFTESMMGSRERQDSFSLFKMEYESAEASIIRRESIYWKEMLAVLSFALNYPAKYLPAEDMIRLQKVLMPLISLVIAFVPQQSAEELLALHEAGKLSIVTVGDQSEIIPQKEGGIIYKHIAEDGTELIQKYETFVDCVGQHQLPYDHFPFQGLKNGGSVSPASVAFRSESEAKNEQFKGNKNVFEQDGKFFLQVSGIAIDDNFRIIGQNGQASQRVFMMAVPYMGGYNPDYSGLDFCQEASSRITEALHLILE